ncbi:MAG: hypothetical protein R3D52_14950 [Xanthobacteraceae bacterium]
MRTTILGVVLTLGLAWLGATAATAAPASGTAIKHAADKASIVTQVPCGMRRVCGRRGCVTRRVCW